jgi:hypothetical protein
MTPFTRPSLTPSHPTLPLLLLSVALLLDRLLRVGGGAKSQDEAEPQPGSG